MFVMVTIAKLLNVFSKVRRNIFRTLCQSLLRKFARYYEVEALIHNLNVRPWEKAEEFYHDGKLIGNFADWAKNVFSAEFTHIKYTWQDAADYLEKITAVDSDADQIEVVEPLSLRDTIKTTAESIVAAHQGAPLIFCAKKIIITRNFKREFYDF